MEIDIDYKMTLEFNFGLKLPITNNAIMSGQDLHIKKLEKEIKILKEFINHNMEITVMYNKYDYLTSVNSQYSISRLLMPINNYNIKILYSPSESSNKNIIYLRNNTCFKCIKHLFKFKYFLLNQL